MNLDHFVLAAPDLEAAKEEFADLTGCLPANGGAHTGLGTHNALCSFGAGAYLEIIAPDPAQNLDGNMGGHLATLPGMTPLHWAVRSTDLPGISERAAAAGFVPGPIRDTAREQPNGEVLNWQLFGIGGHDLGGLFPFFIDWLECPHPAETTPLAGSLETFRVSLPAGPANDFLQGIEGVTLETGVAGIEVVIQPAAGGKDPLTYAADMLTGFSF